MCKGCRWAEPGMQVCFGPLTDKVPFITLLFPYPPFFVPLCTDRRCERWSHHYKRRGYYIAADDGDPARSQDAGGAVQIAGASESSSRHSGDGWSMQNHLDHSWIACLLARSRWALPIGVIWCTCLCCICSCASLVMPLYAWSRKQAPPVWYL